MVVDFSGEHRALSWALLGGGVTCTRGVACCEVRNAELGLDVDARDVLRDKLRAIDRPEHVGLLTSAPVAEFGQASARHQGTKADAVATVGLSNAMRIGQSPGSGAVGTINIVCWVNQALTPEAQLEALSLMVEARTTKVCDARLELADGLATGTGTDCVVMLAPALSQPGQQYAGKHTALGSVVGRAVMDALEAPLQLALQRAKQPRVGKP